MLLMLMLTLMLRRRAGTAAPRTATPALALPQSAS
jgi:hypothetical protein